MSATDKLDLFTLRWLADGHIREAVPLSEVPAVPEASAA